MGRKNTIPHDLDGLDGARRDVRRMVSNLQTFLKNIEACVEEGDYREAKKHALAFAQNTPLLVASASTWFAIGLIAEGVYKNPKEANDV